MKKGIQLAILTAGISGVSIFANGIFVSRTDPLVFAFVRNIVVLAILSMWIGISSHVSHVRALTAKQWWMLVLIGIVGGGIPFALFFTGLAEIGAVNGNIIQKTLFIWVAVMAVPLLGEKIHRMHSIGYALLLVGMFYFGGGIAVVPKTGTWLVLGATVLWAVEQIIAKRTLSHVPPVIVAWGRMLFGVPMLFAAIAILGKIGLLSQQHTYSVAPLTVSAVLLTLYMTTWYSALKRAPAVLVSSVLVAAPVVTALLTRFVLQKPFKEGQMVSLTMLVVGVLFILGEYIKRSKTEQA